MRTDGALNRHLDESRAANAEKLVYDVVADEMVTGTELEKRREARAQVMKEYEEAAQRARTGTMG